MGLLDLPLLRSGKVREVYVVDADRLLMVASDRISAFDVVFDQPIPDKGRVLTGMSTFWFERTQGLVANHLISSDPTDFPPTAEPSKVAGRAMLVRAAEPVMMECIVRGYLFGSAWSEYQRSGTMNGQPLPEGMRQAELLPSPVFTPSTKAEEGHDEALTPQQGRDLVGADLYDQIEQTSLALYEFARQHAESKGLILVDTKFEFGLIDGELTLIDEMCTPDSSRLWAAEDYEVGTSPPSFDKQYVRDYLSETGWDKNPPAPALPDDVVTGTRARYVEAYERVTGLSFDDWFAPERA
ncbi:MAG: phosphoribosylaminoimidazolesuccinocarboxamide synthase [Actinobacteria bacterium]|nr:phosphoribosylaminoimidazolesuccinocarboxamide synthase [Actinomycetota bacterium]MCB9390119.1 phosphoribosylaminoimidazolesuccinocarboxamide synthase [Acidimicrobiia bacterium]